MTNVVDNVMKKIKSVIVKSDKQQKNHQKIPHCNYADNYYGDQYCQ